MNPKNYAVQGHPEKGHLLIEWFEKAGIKDPRPDYDKLKGFRDTGYYGACDGNLFFYYFNDPPDSLTRLTFSEWEAMIKEQETEEILSKWPEPPKPVWDWIEIKEGCEMPEERIRSLICLDGDLEMIGYIDFDGKWKCNDWDFEKDGNGISVVTHWMPLPQPPSTLNSSNQ